jgi:hypothetical protein
VQQQIVYAAMRHTFPMFQRTGLCQWSVRAWLPQQQGLRSRRSLHQQQMPRYFYFIIQSIFSREFLKLSGFLYLNFSSISNKKIKTLNKNLWENIANFIKGHNF